MQKMKFLDLFAGIGGFRIRKLTPRECWRLQGFPDWAFDKAQEVNSNSQLYKQAGNSVTVNVISAIAQGLGGN
ncbi:DNA methylase [Streptococcus pneumoniae]|nr:DNA methylase [Streptococcus pneumoniae]VTA35667.1 DNA methylase [Streptococcus pneumoniae]